MDAEPAVGSGPPDAPDAPTGDLWAAAGRPVATAEGARGNDERAGAGDLPPDASPTGYVVEHRASPAHRAVPLIGGARPRAALAIAVGMGLVALGIAAGDHGPSPAAPATAGPATVAPRSAAPATELAVADPESSGAPEDSGTSVPQAGLRATEVRLPTLDVRSTLVDLDVDPDGALAAPGDPNLAGWFVRGAVPGQPGPTVIAGHVDSRSGPAVFYRLDELAPGDRVEVARSDGQVFAYRVATVETAPKDAFPTARVYGPTPGPELRLITCGGEFDQRSRHYRDNVVVTAIPAT